MKRNQKFPQNKENRQIQKISRTQSYSGILPLASEFEKYEQICPGAAKEILSHATKQIDHRIKMGESIVNANIKNQKVGMFLGFLIVFVIVVFGFILLLMDKKIEGFATLLFTALGYGGLFIYNQKKETKVLIFFFKNTFQILI